MKRFSNILLIADAGTNPPAALNRAVALAENNQAFLTVVGVVEEVFVGSTTPTTSTELRDFAVSEKHENLSEIIKTIAEAEAIVEMKVLVGKPFFEIIRQVLRFDHDLVIKCAEGVASVRDTLFGSTDMHLMRKCLCPVWIITWSGASLR